MRWLAFRKGMLTGQVKCKRVRQNVEEMGWERKSEDCLQIFLISQICRQDAGEKLRAVRPLAYNFKNVTLKMVCHAAERAVVAQLWHLTQVFVWRRMMLLNIKKKKVLSQHSEGWGRRIIHLSQDWAAKWDSLKMKKNQLRGSLPGCSNANGKQSHKGQQIKWQSD